MSKTPLSPAKIGHALLGRYLAGECTPDEVALVEQWRARSPIAAAVMQWLAKGRMIDDGEGADTDIDALWQRVAGRMEDGQERPRASALLEARREEKEQLPRLGLRTVQETRGGFRARTLRKWGWTAAAIVTTLVVTKLTFRSGPAHATTQGRTYATGPDQQATVVLGDGTRVTLAPRTILRTLNDGGVTRTVILEGETGEAYFEVAPSSNGAFQVRSGPFTTRVLGTTFMVRHPAGASRIRVAVAEGKVSVTTVSQQHPSVTLTAGAIGEVDDSTVQVNTVNELAPKTEWLRGRLVFRDMTVATVLQTLGRWYGYEFRCADPTLALQTVTIGVNMRSSSAALATLEDVLRVNLKVVGDTVTLTPQANRQERTGPRVRSYDVWTPIREVGR